MKYRYAIFLDIDGVLNHQEWYRKNDVKTRGENWIDIDPNKVIMMNHLVEDLGGDEVVAVVLISTWRMSRTVEEINDLFKKVGSTFEILDKTPVSTHRFRGLEIKEWLSQNSVDVFGVQDHRFHRYAIIDDDSDMCLDQQEKFFRINTESGITSNDIYRIKNYLKRYDYANR